MAADVRFLLGEAAGARIVLGDLGFELAAFGAQFRRLGGERGKRCLGVVQHIQRGFGAGGCLFAGLGAVALGFDRLLLAVEAGQHLARLGDGMILALGILLDLLKPRLQLRLALRRALLLAVERVALHLDAVQHGRAGCLLLAERLQRIGVLGLHTQRRGLRLRELAHGAQRIHELRLLGLHGGVGGGIVLVMLNGFELAQLRGQLLVFLRLARLPPQIRKLAAELADHVLETFEIGFGGLEAHFGLVAAAIETRDAGRVL